MKSKNSSLSHFLADSTILYVKILNYHWNMMGPQFFMFHKLLEEQYKELAEAIDVIAERIRQLGQKAPGTMKEFLALACLEEGKSSKSQDQMVHELARDHLLIVEHCKKLIEEFEEDQGTQDMLIDRMRAHDKHAWLLGSHKKK